MEIKNIKMINKGCLICKFDLYLPNIGLTIHECTFFKKGDRDWISMPSKPYESKEDGKTKYFSYVHWDEERAKSLNAKVTPLISDEIARKEYFK